jgi:hypothetical protein
MTDYWYLIVLPVVLGQQLNDSSFGTTIVLFSAICSGQKWPSKKEVLVTRATVIF